MAWVAPLACGALLAAAAEFRQARPGYAFEFPRDHFEHADFSTEWWYYTGNLRAEDGRRFGFELTFFRVGLGRAGERATAWDLDQVYLAHFAVSDVRGERLLRSERTNRSGPGLAGASREQAAVWNGNWRVDYLPGDPLRPPQRLEASSEGVAIRLSLVPAKPVVVHGERGVSRKAGGAGQASHYLSFTRLQASGSLMLDGTEHEVEGLAWMDHEFFSEGLSADLVGWDWMSAQLEDGTELMLYGLRGPSGQHSRFSSGTFVDTDGAATRLDSSEFSLHPGRLWESDETGAAYPVEWTVEVTSLDLELAVRPLLDDQELTSPTAYTPVYWEGAVEYVGRRSGQDVRGRGYLEMTGYDKPFALAGRSVTRTESER